MTTHGITLPAVKMAQNRQVNMTNTRATFVSTSVDASPSSPAEFAAFIRPKSLVGEGRKGRRHPSPVNRHLVSRRDMV